ncbi:Vacuolar transporter chaperone 3 [Vanrija pseudolonga]|uniref:Vacuolar transporter chaperone 3 n=1 Tax=Vanrija pseudolonga TaxID=143232 RepID=A0AAF0Y5I5_9TREE|nr:Vacuolar transporter chaperone 3 [Vanrija pseudolonga]
MSETTPLNPNNNGESSTGVQRVLNDVSELFWQPFSQTALKLLPNRGEGLRAKSKRGDNLPDAGEERPLLTDYHAINDPSIRVRVPKKKPTPVKVEAKVWFANERTYISYLSMGLLLSTIATGLLFGAQDSLARRFAYTYALIAAGVLIYGYVTYQKRLTLIAGRYAGSFDQLWGPLFICAALFIAILANFILKLEEAKKAHNGTNPLSFANAWAVAGQKSTWLN